MTAPKIRPPAWLTLAPEVRDALENGRAVVALESTVITHGLPRPVNLETAAALEAEVRSAGATPATAAVLDGVIRLGLNSAELETLALGAGTIKVSRADLGRAMAQGLTGGTTVAATMIVAHAVGVRVFATGGIGGVHRGDSGDVSADLPELARTPVAVVCAGAKAILDLPRTLEWLETAGVPVIGWGTDTFPAFFSRSSGLPLVSCVGSAREAAAVLFAHWDIGLNSGALLCVPCPEAEAVPYPDVEALLVQAEVEAAEAGVRGKALTPFLLGRLAEWSSGRTLTANLALLRQNARVGAKVAIALAITIT